MADRTGQQLGNYLLTRSLGQGGFAEVYLGKHMYLETLAAIKISRGQLTPQQEQEFRNEARTIAKLIHPNIVRVLEYGIDQNRMPFFVMDYAPHGTLRDRHPQGSILPLTTIHSYVKQTATALLYAHNQKIIHRDVKPENMLVDANNNILLSDFGIAVVAHSTRSQKTEEVIGTWLYTAPEQFKGKPQPASDQYALGIIVYEWLCGITPFQGSIAELYNQHLFVPPPPLHAKVPTISSSIERAVLKALAKEPEQRFPSVQEFATALEQAIMGRPPTIVKPPPSQSLATFSSSVPPTQMAAPTPPRFTPIQNIGAQAVRRNWWIVGLRGVLAIIFGLIALFAPGISLFAFIIVFAAYALIDGIVAVVIAIQERGSLSRWGWVLFEGIISILASTVALVYPGITALALLSIVAIYAILTGILEIVAAFVIRGFAARERALRLAGILSIIFGVILFVVRPGAGLLAILWLVGIYAIIFGILFIVRAFQMRSLASSVTA